MPGEDSKPKISMRFLGIVLLCLSASALLALIASQWKGAVGAIGIGVEILLASFALGAALGFLFAVPRVLSQPPGENKQAGSDAVSRFLQSNSNLEKISDWLTTMLVGVGLSQLYRINEALVEFRDFIDAHGRVYENGTAGALPVIAPFLLIFGLIAGFLFMYLHTRIDLVRLFDEVEDLLSGEAKRALVGAAKNSGSPLAGRFLAGRQLTVETALNVMFDLLYEPAGYKEVIGLESTLSKTPLADKAAYWFYLAAAYGQEHAAAEKAHDSSAAAAARLKALETAQKAVALDPGYRARLWNISNPNGLDNDLATLRDDDDFLKIVGR